MNKIKIFLLCSIICFIVTILWFGLTFAPGSYANIEKYEFNIPEEELIKNINKLKILEPNLKEPIEYTKFEGRKNSNDYWYHFFIYYPEENEVLNCWVRSSSVNSSKLALVSIMSKGKWKSIEEDFDASEIEIQKKKFEDRFINKLKKMELKKD